MTTTYTAIVYKCTYYVY